MSSNASNMSAFIFALILDILPIVFTIAVMFKIKELREKLLKEWKKEKTNYLKLEIKKNYFQIISFIICFLALACVLFSLTVWGKAKFLTGIMLIGLWFVLFGISILIVLLLSFLLDWLKKDNYRDSSLPRTTIFWGFVAAIVAALL